MIMQIKMQEGSPTRALAGSPAEYDTGQDPTEGDRD